MSGKQKLYINGKWTETVNYSKLYSPYTQEEIADIPIATKEQVDAAIESANNTTKTMRDLSALKKSEILSEVARLFKKYKEECAAILVKENAKPIKAARGEIDRTIETYQFAAEQAKNFSGEIIPMDAAKNGANHFGFTKYEPLGVVAAITPFNFPFNLTAHKLAPAIAVGNTIILKPASQTPLSGLMTARIFEEAGLPAGALNIVTGKGSIIGDQLVEDPRVKMITFTGSAPVGKSIRKKAGLKKVSLELGSNSGVIVDSTEDIKHVVARCVEGAFTFSGQVCISIQRIYVKNRLYKEFLSQFINEVKKLKVGNPADENTDISALISKDEVSRLDKWIEEAVSQGAVIQQGGKMDDSILRPTVLTGASKELSVNCREAFGP